MTFDFTSGKEEVIIHDQRCEPWRVTVIDTGLDTMTGGRVKRIQPFIGNNPFMLTYGDGVCDVNIRELYEFHKSHGKLATLTAVIQQQQKGIINIGGDNAVKSFREKNVSDGAPINAGYMVLQPEIFDYIGRRHRFRAAAPRKARRRGSADVLYAQGILAVHGQHPRV